MAELRGLFAPAFGHVMILENLEEPPTEIGRAAHAERWSQGGRGDVIPDLDTTWLHNTHSFMCFLRAPRKS